MQEAGPGEAQKECLAKLTHPGAGPLPRQVSEDKSEDEDGDKHRKMERKTRWEKETMRGGKGARTTRFEADFNPAARLSPWWAACGLREQPITDSR